MNMSLGMTAVSYPSRYYERSVPVTPPSTFYVSPDGSDTHDGSQGQPFQTLLYAQDVIRPLLADMTTDIVVYLRDGLHPVDDLVFLADDSGQNDHMVVYAAYPGERPVITGGITIDGWTHIGGGVYQASVPSGLRFRQLYVNGVRGIRARTPNTGSVYRVLNWNTSNRTITVNASEIANWARLTEVEMVIAKRWNEVRLRVASFSVSGSVATIVPMEPERTQFFAHGLSPSNATYYFENAMELLTDGGEWYLNTATNQVFYKQRANENLATAVVMVPSTESLIRLQGTPDSVVKNLRFTGIEFAEAGWAFPSSSGFTPIQADFLQTPIRVVPTAVTVEFANNIWFERNVFRAMGGSGLGFARGVTDSTVVGNRVEDISGSGITIDHDLFLSYDDPRYTCRRNRLANNYVWKVGQEFAGSVGIFAGYTDATTIHHNELTACPYSGINVGWGWTLAQTALQNNSVRYNRLWAVMARLADGGGVYTLSNQPGTRLSDNYMHDIVRHPLADADPVAGLFLDEGTDHITMVNNLVQRSAAVYYINTTNQGTHNTIDGSVPDGVGLVAAAGLETPYTDIRP